jgi:Glycine rich protein
VTPGQILFIDVAGNGISGAAGFNGGGTRGSGPFGGGGGGGASDIRTISRAAGNDTTTLSSRLLIAGGGGGGGGGTTDGAGHAGGNAGQLASGDGSNGEGSAGAGGFGGTQTRGGFSWGTPAGLGQGGGGQDGFSAGGGGGGGLFGGGGGLRAADGFGAGGGGAGSSGFAPTATSTAFSTDTTGVPLVRLTFNPASGKNASGLKYGKVKLNKSKGTALLPVTVPGSGDLSVGGKGVVKKRPAFSGFARLARAITAAGTYNVVVKAKGKKKQKLFSTGKVNVKAVITFKPTSGDAVHDTRGVRLKKN